LKNFIKLSIFQNWTKSFYPIHVFHPRKRDDDDYFVQFFSRYNKFISEYHHETFPSFIFLLQHQTCEVLKVFGVSPHFHHFWYNVKHFRHQKPRKFGMSTNWWLQDGVDGLLQKIKRNHQSWWTFKFSFPSCYIDWIALGLGLFKNKILST